MVFAAQVGLDRTVIEGAEVGQHRIDYGFRWVGAEAAVCLQTLPHHLGRESGEDGRSHILTGLFQCPARTSGWFDGAAVDEYQAAGEVGFGRRQLQRHVRAPGVADDHRPLPSHGPDKACRVFGDGGEIEAIVHLSGLAVSPLVKSGDAEIGGQRRSHQVPDVAGGRQPMQQKHRLALAAPVPVVEREAAQVDMAILGVVHG